MFGLGSVEGKDGYHLEAELATVRSICVTRAFLPDCFFENSLLVQVGRGK